MNAGRHRPSSQTVPSGDHIDSAHSAEATDPVAACNEEEKEGGRSHDNRAARQTRACRRISAPCRYAKPVTAATAPFRRRDCGLIEACRQGARTTQLLDDHGIHRTTVWAHLERAGIPTASRARNHRRAGRLGRRPLRHRPLAQERSRWSLCRRRDTAQGVHASRRCPPTHSGRISNSGQIDRNPLLADPPPAVGAQCRKRQTTQNRGSRALLRGRRPDNGFGSDQALRCEFNNRATATAGCPGKPPGCQVHPM